jgi:hypothetical protein
MKSKNSRMGAGVGSLVRLTTYIHGGSQLIRVWRYSFFSMQQIAKYLTFKLNLPLKLLSSKNFK